MKDRMRERQREWTRQNKQLSLMWHIYLWQRKEKTYFKQFCLSVRKRSNMTRVDTPNLHIDFLPFHAKKLWTANKFTQQPTQNSSRDCFHRHLKYVCVFMFVCDRKVPFLSFLRCTKTNTFQLYDERSKLVFCLFVFFSCLIICIKQKYEVGRKATKIK